MRVLVWVLRAAVFLLLLGLAAKNSGIVTLQLFFGATWHVPLVFVMLLFFAAGALVGLTAALATLFRQRREIARLRRESGSAMARPAVRRSGDQST